MKIFLLTDDYSNGALQKFTSAILANGHYLTDKPSEADRIIVGPDISIKKFDFISTQGVGLGESYITYNNWLARTFEAY
jgi:hypothetical protein